MIVWHIDNCGIVAVRYLLNPSAGHGSAELEMSHILKCALHDKMVTVTACDIDPHRQRFDKHGPDSAAGIDGLHSLRMGHGNISRRSGYACAECDRIITGFIHMVQPYGWILGIRPEIPAPFECNDTEYIIRLTDI